MRYTTRFLLLILLLTSRIVLAQQYYFTHYQVDDGLAHNSVTAIMQDSKGLMWIGTRGGLNRFDGYTFRSFRNNLNKFGTLGNNVILSIAEDKKGTIWVGTGRGLFRYDPKKEAFTELALPRAGGAHDLHVGNSDRLWFISRGLLYRYDPKVNKITASGLRATCMGLDAHENAWLGRSDGSIEQYNPNLKHIKTVQILRPDLPVNTKYISKIIIPHNGTALVGTTKQGLKSYDQRTGVIRSLLARNADNTEVYVRDILMTEPDECWVASESGIYIYNLRTHSGQNLKKRAGDNYSIADNAVYALCKDSQGGLWAGTFFGGINYYSPENARFEKYFPVMGINSISGNAVREICGDEQGDIWIGTEDAGVNKLNVRTGKFTNYTTDGKPGSISYPNIHGLLAVGNKLYIGPFQHGLEVMDMKTGRVVDRFKMIGEKNMMVNDFVMSIRQTTKGDILIGTTGNGAGLFKYDAENKAFDKVSLMPPDTYVYDIFEDHTGAIWTGSFERGAFHYDPNTSAHGNIRFSGSSQHTEYAVQGIYEDKRHNLWFATEGGGLVKLGPDRKTIKKFTTENGLPSNYLFRILDDNAGNLWISSVKGLICFDMRTEQVKVYTRSNGLITDQFNYNSAYKAPNGKMYFGSVKGMIAFDPVRFGKTTTAPPTYITGFQVGNKEMIPGVKDSPLKRSALYTDTVVLLYNKASFSIEFAALSYSSPKVTRYKYLMKGLDRDWTYLNTNRKAYFTDLSPGNYTFVVKAESNVGSWTGRERHLIVQILPPFWRTGIAYMVYIILLIVIVYLCVRYYKHYLESKNLRKLQRFEQQKQKEVYESKIEFFTNIAHEIQTPLTLIIGPVEQVMKQVDEVPAAKKSLQLIARNADRLLKLTTQLLDFRKTETDQFGLSFVKANISNLLKEQLEAFAPEAKKAKVELSLSLPKKHVVAYVDVEAFNKICSNLVSNAIKYGGTKAEVSIPHFSADETTFNVVFTNDGKAIPDEHSDRIFEPFFRSRATERPGTGVGLSLARSLAELHNGSLKLTSGVTDHIQFELTLPVHQKFEFKLSGRKSTKLP